MISIYNKAQKEYHVGKEYQNLAKNKALCFDQSKKYQDCGLKSYKKATFFYELNEAINKINKEDKKGEIENE